MIEIITPQWMLDAKEFGELYPVCPRCQSSWMPVDETLYIECSALDCTVTGDSEDKLIKRKLPAANESDRDSTIEWDVENETCFWDKYVEVPLTEQQHQENRAHYEAWRNLNGEKADLEVKHILESDTHSAMSMFLKANGSMVQIPPPQLPSQAVTAASAFEDALYKHYYGENPLISRISVPQGYHPMHRPGMHVVKTPLPYCTPFTVTLERIQELLIFT